MGSWFLLRMLVPKCCLQRICHDFSLWLMELPWDKSVQVFPHKFRLLVWLHCLKKNMSANDLWEESPEEQCEGPKAGNRRSSGMFVSSSHVRFLASILETRAGKQKKHFFEPMLRRLARILTYLSSKVVAPGISKTLLGIQMGARLHMPLYAGTTASDTASDSRVFPHLLTSALCQFPAMDAYHTEAQRRVTAGDLSR